MAVVLFEIRSDFLAHASP